MNSGGKVKAMKDMAIVWAMTNGLLPNSDFGSLTSRKSSISFSIVGLFTTVLPASAVVTAVMSFLSPFPVMEEIFVHHAIKSASSSSGSFFAPRSWQKFPIGTSFSHSPRSFGVISYTIANFLGK